MYKPKKKIFLPSIKSYEEAMLNITLDDKLPTPPVSPNPKNKCLNNSDDVRPICQLKPKPKNLQRMRKKYLKLPHINGGFQS